MAELNFLGLRVPMPVAAVVGRLQLSAPNVEKYRRVKGNHLSNQEVLDILPKSRATLVVLKVPGRGARLGDSVDHTRDELLRTVLPLGSAVRSNSSLVWST